MSGSDDVYDLIIVGGGPGGLTAGIYGARADLRTLVVEKGLPGGQMLLTWKVDNYPGFPGGSGAELAQQMEEQARRSGCFFLRDEVTAVDLAADPKRIVTGGGTLLARGVILAGGARSNRLGVPGEADFVGRGVSYCGTCDGAFFRDLPVAVVGGGDTAVEEAIFLTRFARSVHLIHRREKLRAVLSEQRELMANPKVTVVWDTVVEEITGDASGVTGVSLKNVRTWERSRLEVAGVFVFVGITPNSELLRGALTLDEWGFVLTDETCRTAIPCVYAVGDIRSKGMRQIANAVGEGATAAFFLEKSLRSY